MPQFVSGAGGFVQISMDGQTWLTLDIATWTLNRTKRLADVTTSGHAASNFESVMPDNSWRLEAPWDVLAPLDSLVTQSKIFIRFKHGSSAVLRAITATTVETIETVDVVGTDVVRVNMSGKGGVVS